MTPLNIHPAFPVCPGLFSTQKAAIPMDRMTDCKSVKTGSIPVPASSDFNGLQVLPDQSVKSLNKLLNIHDPFGRRSARPASCGDRPHCARWRVNESRTVARICQTRGGAAGKG